RVHRAVGYTALDRLKNAQRQARREARGVVGPEPRTMTLVDGEIAVGEVPRGLLVLRIAIVERDRSARHVLGIEVAMGSRQRVVGADVERPSEAIGAGERPARI